jgi:hypothetical protein
VAGRDVRTRDPASIATPHVIVMSHGWSPGYRDVYEQLQGAQPAHW